MQQLGGKEHFQSHLLFHTQKPQFLRDNDSWWIRIKPCHQHLQPKPPPHSCLQSQYSCVLPVLFLTTKHSFYSANQITLQRSPAEKAHYLSYVNNLFLHLRCPPPCYFWINTHRRRMRGAEEGDQWAARLQIPDVAHVEKGALDRPCPTAPG